MRLIEPPEYVAEYYLARFEGKSFVMVEGPTDRALWEEYTEEQDCSLYPTKIDEGKDEILEALTTSWLRGLRGFAGIVDADYWLVSEADVLRTENLLYDDTCPDVETILVDSGALRKALRNNLDRYDVNDIHCFADKLVDEAQRMAMEIGYFRLLNYCEDYGISFKRLWKRYRRLDFFDENSHEFYRENFSMKLKEFCRWTADIDLLFGVDQLKEKHKSPDIRLCQGKDVLAILADIFPIQFRSEFGKDAPPSVRQRFSHSELSRELRVAYDSRYFRKTSLYAAIRKWEEVNCCYKILEDDI